MGETARNAPGVPARGRQRWQTDLVFRDSGGTVVSIGNLSPAVNLACKQLQSQPSEVLGNLLIRFRADGSVAVYPNTGNPLQLAGNLAGLLSLLHPQPALIPAICGFEEQGNECGER
jgi:hypothetical protein